MSGEATPVQIGAFLTGLRLRGETVDEIAGAVATMRAKMTPVEAPAGAIDIVGTGGDASGSYNISTDLGLRGRRRRRAGRQARQPRAVVANRAPPTRWPRSASRSTSTPEAIARCIREAGIGFMFAPAHHSAMKHVGPARAELGFRTVFNLIGPLSNPASVKRYLLGVFSPDWVEPLANVLGEPRRRVAPGSSTATAASTRCRPAGETKVAALKDGNGHDLHRHARGRRPEACAGRGDQGRRRRPQRRGAARGARRRRGAYRDTVLLNAGAALVVAGMADDLARARRSPPTIIDQGKAADRLDRLIAVSNG